MPSTYFFRKIFVEEVDVTGGNETFTGTLES